MTRLLPCAATLFLLASPAFAQVTLQPGTESFIVTQNDKHLGETQLSISPITGGFTLQSSGQMKADTFSYSFQNNEVVDTHLNLVRDDLTGSVHGSKASGNDIRFDTTSSASGRDFDIRINADGKQTTNTVNRHRNLVLMPDLDPAAYTLMAHFALEDPQTSWVLIPKQNGILVPAEYRLLPDLQGSMNGQNMTVKHAAIAISVEASIVVEVFYTPSGELLEADLNAQGLRVAQPSFKLFNRPAPIPPPSAQTSEQGEQGNQPGGQQPEPQPEAQSGQPQ